MTQVTYDAANTCLAAIDIETDMIDDITNDVTTFWMIGCAVEKYPGSIRKGEYEYFDIVFPHGVTKEELALAVADSFTYTQPNIPRLKTILASNFDSGQGKFCLPVFHNSKFDMRHLSEAGFQVSPYFHDSMLVMSQLHPDVDAVSIEGRRTKHSLAAWGARGWCDAKLESPDFQKFSVEMAVYNKGDCVSTLQLARKGLDLLVKDVASWGCYICIDLPFVWKVIELERNGVRVDPNAASYFALACDIQVQQYLERIRKEVPAAPGAKLGDVVNPRDNVVPNYFPGMRLEAMHVGMCIPEGQVFNERRRRVLYRYRKVEQFNPDSPTQKQWAIQTYFPSYEPSRLAKNGGPVTDASEIDRLRTKYPTVEWLSDLVDYAKYSKVNSTYVPCFTNKVDSETSRMYASWWNTDVKTGRLSSSNPPMQTMPNPGTALGKAARNCIVPRSGYKLVVLDLSQIELRVLAWDLVFFLGNSEYADAWYLWNEYQKGEEADVHTMAAAELYQVDRKDVTKAQRALGKKLNFSDIYGIGPGKLARDQRIPVLEATELLKKRHASLPSIQALKELTWQRCANSKEYPGCVVHTIFGRRGVYPDILSPNKWERMRAERQVFNFRIQGTAGNVLSILCLQNTPNEVKAGARLILQVHDELVWEVPEGNAPWFEQAAKATFQTKDLLPGMPLLVDTTIVEKYGEAK